AGTSGAGTSGAGTSGGGASSAGTSAAGARGAAWRTPRACREALAGGVERPDGRARVASWNLRWFPDGSSHGPSEQPTDVEWAACVLAALRVDVVALQEILLHARGRAALARLTDRLDALTGGRWESRFDGCRRDGRQHVGFLWDASRVEARRWTALAELNPLGGCAHHLRPGLAVDLRWRGGLDLHAVVVHLDSGREARDHGHRRQSLVALEDALGRLRAQRMDDDLLVLGDFNTMGCRTCPGQAQAARELAWLDARIGGMQPALRRVRVAEGRPACTEYYRGRGGLLDHVLASVPMRELSPGARLEAAGPCADHPCRLPRGRDVPFLQRLSDHCPIVVELSDRDDD
ncbi:MAG TPA: endonuclease/exonuclease/phosphatase family protein, partial [Sandaracinaceae bacterium LLY-WYZ-13_1]|nr:endonuclease/exonuclease/phosphatase family protein [Sandaracinaceae bacterium LLY-WYZ-13_1]